MGKGPKMVSASRWNNKNQSCVLLAKGIGLLLLGGFAFHLFFHHSRLDLISSGSDPSAAAAAVAQDEDVQKGQCHLSVGAWVPTSSGPFYRNESCIFIEDHQNCMKNGRADTDYLYWRWKPRDCELPRFDAERFLNRMRNKSWGFVGDSISRNHAQSLLCLLSQVERAEEFYHDVGFKSRKWKFPSYNVTIAMIWSPFLLKAEIFEDSNGVSTADVQLFLDTLDKEWVEYQNFDYIITAGGQWFLKTAIYWENKKVVGCHGCLGQNITELGFNYAYRKAISLVLNFLLTSYKGVALFRTSSPSHFENGEWFSGGTCPRTRPFSEEDATLEDGIQVMYNIELEEFNKVAKAQSTSSAHLKLLDTTNLSLLRPDGHPGPYRHFHPFAENKTAKVQNDCLHWCLPGPIDSWNDLVMELVLNK